jgi:hypothetical protein
MPSGKLRDDTQHRRPFDQKKTALLVRKRERKSERFRVTCMTSLDYTELFVKGGGGSENSQQLTIDDIYQEGGDSGGNEGNLITTGTNRNFDSLVEIEDQSTWVLNQIEALGFSSPNSEFSHELIQIFSSLFREVTD